LGNALTGDEGIDSMGAYFFINQQRKPRESPHVGFPAQQLP
jgi:hypothetical protein